jgi:hypothetical protein
MAANQVEDFRCQIGNLGTDFVCQTHLPATLASISFLGPFQGQVVLWNMTLATLSHWQRHGSDTPISGSESFNSQFIEIAEVAEAVFRLRVGLEVEHIDEPVIKKTIIMIRNYRRLAIGRSGFGSIQT